MLDVIFALCYLMHQHTFKEAGTLDHIRKCGGDTLYYYIKNEQSNALAKSTFPEKSWSVDISSSQLIGETLFIS